MNSITRNLKEYLPKQCKYIVRAMYKDGSDYKRECINAISLMLELDKISNDATIVRDSIYVINTNQLKG